MDLYGRISFDLYHWTTMTQPSLPNEPQYISKTELKMQRKRPKQKEQTRWMHTTLKYAWENLVRWYAEKRYV